MPIDDRTTNRSYQLPNAANQLIEDVARLRAALNAIDADIFARYTKTETDQKIADLINSAPGALDTLDELAAALGDDANFAATVTTALSNRYTKTESDALITALINGAPANLNTLQELAAALSNDPNYSATVAAALANRYTKTESDGRYLIQPATAASGGGFIDFTGIPSWARRVTMLFNRISINSADNILIQLGVGTTPVTGGYIDCLSVLSASAGIYTITSTAGVPIFNNLSTYSHTGRAVIERFDNASNNWIVTVNTNSVAGVVGSIHSTGIAPVGGALGMVRLLPASPAAFDAGSVNISWE